MTIKYKRITKWREYTYKWEKNTKETTQALKPQQWWKILFLIFLASLSNTKMLLNLLGNIWGAYKCPKDINHNAHIILSPLMKTSCLYKLLYTQFVRKFYKSDCPKRYMGSNSIQEMSNLHRGYQNALKERLILLCKVFDCPNQSPGC